MNRFAYSLEQSPELADETALGRRIAEVFSDHLCAAEISFFDDRPNYLRANFVKAGSLLVSDLDASFATVNRTHHHVQFDTRGDYIIGTMLNGARSFIRQDGREAIRDVGQAILYTNGATIEATHDVPVKYRGLTIPAKLLAERVPNFENLVLRPLDPTPALHYLQGYLSFLVNSEAEQMTALNDSVSGHLLDLVVLVLGAGGETADLAKARGLRAVRLREAIKEIERRAFDPAFSTDTLSKALGISRRYLNEILFESGTTFTERVLELRLQRARAMFASPACDRMKVVDIAYECGFSDISYFNRRFRARFGCSPVQFRNGP